MKSLAIVSALASVALAQSATSTASALIPTGISTDCTKFLTDLNSNSTLSACTTPLISATSAYGPGGNATSASSAQISSALNTVCASSSACSEATVRGKLADFYTACSAELTSSPNDDVLRTYDVLYALTPLKSAVCAKDDSGRYCATQLSSIVSGTASSSASAASASASGVASSLGKTLASGLSLAAVQKYLWSSSTAALSRRASSTSAATMVPNATTYAASNIVFLFLQPALSSAALCTSCTRNVLTSYINFESDVPYAPGLTNSALLGGQSALYSKVQSECGGSFLSGAVQAAGSLSGGLVDSGAAPAVSRAAAAVTALGAMALGAFAML